MKKKKTLPIPPPKFVEQLHSTLLSKKGWIAAVEPESGKYVLAKTLLEASRKARNKFPGKVFYFIRIGYSYVHRQVGGLKLIDEKN